MDSEQKRAPLSLEELLTQVESDPTLREKRSPNAPPPGGISPDSMQSGGFSPDRAQTGGASPGATPGNASPDAATPASEGAGASPLSALLSSGDLISKLPQLLKVVGNLRESPAPPPSKNPSPVALLSALRPYLNEHRRQALDTMIRLSKLSDSLQALR